jgi:hypothetical protein
LHITEFLVDLLDPLFDRAKEIKVVQRFFVPGGGQAALGHEARLDRVETRGDIGERAASGLNELVNGGVHERHRIRPPTHLGGYRNLVERLLLISAE